MPRSLIFLILVLLVSGQTLAQDTFEEPIWPLDLPTRYLTSNFMEYRPGRFHAGLDLKTQTVNGFAARAVEDGWIVRVRATPTAYGRAVYLRGESGRTYVYAHLSRFNDQLRGLVNAQRSRTGTYRARLQFKAGKVRVKQGDVLGLTGESGTGGPHLHFEVRDRNNRPMEPQAVGFSVGDTIAPVIHQLRVWPVLPETLIQGVEQGHILAVEGGLSGEQPALRVTGPVAFSARIVDGSDIRGHRLEPSLIEVRLDGELVYSCRNESHDFAENALQRLEWAVMPGVREHWLHRHPANTLTGREGDLWYLGDKGQGLAPARHKLTITAADWAGNTTVASLDLVVDGGPHGLRSLESYVWQPEVIHPRISTADSMSHIDITPFFDVDSEVVRAEVSGIQRREYRPEAGDPVQAAMVMYSRPVVLTEGHRQAAANQGLRPLGVAREFLAADWPIEASVPVEMEEPQPAKGLDRKLWGLYRWDGTEWDRSGPWRQTAKGAVKLDRPGLHAVLADLSGPILDNPDQPIAVARGPESEITGVTLPYWEVLPVAVWDLGSGLAAETIKVLLDGEPLIVEPDLPRDRILIELPDGLAPGLHKLAIEAADRVGHTVARVLEIRAGQ